MNVLFDTSVLIAGLIASHQHHAVCIPWIKAARQGKVGLFVCVHSLAEMYSTFSGKINSPFMPTQDAWQLIHLQILPIATIVELQDSDYQPCLSRMAGEGQRGGIVYDALIVQSALKARVDRLLTLNEKHFQRVWPNHTDQVINPLTTQVP